MQATVTVGHTVNLSIIFLDTAGLPMVTPPALSAPPLWSDSNPAVGTLVAAADGMTATDKAISVGLDTVSLKLETGQGSYSANLDIVASAAPQTLGSIQIGFTVS